MTYAKALTAILALGPCSDGRDYLNQHTDVDHALDEASTADLAWLAGKIDRKALDEAVAPARKALDEAVATAR